MNLHLHFRHGWFFAIFIFCAGLVLANVIHYVIFRFARSKQVGMAGWGWGLQKHLGKPARAIFVLTCILMVLPAIPNLPDNIEYYIRHFLFVVMVILLGWFAVGCIYVIQDRILRRYDIHAEDNVQARRIHTQFVVFRRILISFVVIIDAAVVLWTFDNPRIWTWGSGLLASAGVASLILATAAKSTASNFLAGMQIALTQPIRIDDVVVIQGEWGRIEEITGAYVVVKIWDLRRLIVPLSFFIENSFQNWTRDSSEILGTAFLYVDYTVPVAALREQLDRIVHPSHLWNGKVCGLQVTNLTDRVMEIRCLMSSRNSSENFDLRCVVREQMIAWIAENYPGAFPTARQISTLSAGTDANPEDGDSASEVVSTLKGLKKVR